MLWHSHKYLSLWDPSLCFISFCSAFRHRKCLLSLENSLFEILSEVTQHTWVRVRAVWQRKELGAAKDEISRGGLELLLCQTTEPLHKQGSQTQR